MSALETVWLVSCSVLGFAGVVSLQQARFYDGDADAHWTRRGRDLAFFHAARHPHAIRAKRRGWLLTSAAVGLTTAGFLARAFAAG